MYFVIIIPLLVEISVLELLNLVNFEEVIYPLCQHDTTMHARMRMKSEVASSPDSMNDSFFIYSSFSSAAAVITFPEFNLAV